MNIPNSKTAKLVKQAISARKMSLEECCRAFNAKYSEEINSGAVRALNKDFISRVTRNNFKICGSRILKLCEFLEIKEPDRQPDPLQVLIDQIGEFEKRVQTDASFKAKFSAIASFLVGLNLKRMRGENQDEVC
ncbi:MAG: hypothetical protein F4Y78_07635 [Candidatus Dadabacteria bacterium]|nr:hypothetical protein [Candidatus Dadabacteria bacterium]MYA48930.1 hypothetical protein [Candidatus Dadabacteria bacterium]MYK49054.1 hypothetical protein [Candidatus Dadabacteria bacterium]